MFKPTLLIAGLMAASSLAQANTVAVSPSASFVNLNDVFSIDIIGLGFTTPLDAGGLSIHYDPSVIAPVLISAPDQFVSYGASWNTNLQPTDSGGTLTDALFFADTAPSGDFDIFTLSFEAIGIGDTAISLSESLINPFAGNGAALPVELLGGRVSVSAVPVPAAVWLFASGLLGLGAVGRRLVPAA